MSLGQTPADPADHPQPHGKPWLACGDDYVTMRIAARPGAGRHQIIRLTPQGLVVALVAPPDRGKANEELIDLVAHAAGVSRSAVTIVHGAGSRHKTVRIATSEPAALAAALRKLEPEKSGRSASRALTKQRGVIT